MVKQLKNRYNSKNMNHKFLVGINRAKMKLGNPTASDSIMPEPSKGKKVQPDDFFKRKKAASSFSDWKM